MVQGEESFCSLLFMIFPGPNIIFIFLDSSISSIENSPHASTCFRWEPRKASFTGLYLNTLLCFSFVHTSMAIKYLSVSVPVENRWHSQFRIIPVGFIYRETICKVEPTKSGAVTWLNNGRAVIIAGPERKDGEGNSFQKKVRETWVEKAMSIRKYSII